MYKVVELMNENQNDKFIRSFCFHCLDIFDQNENFVDLSSFNGLAFWQPNLMKLHRKKIVYLALKQPNSKYHSFQSMRKRMETKKKIGKHQQ